MPKAPAVLFVLGQLFLSLLLLQLWVPWFLVTLMAVGRMITCSEDFITKAYAAALTSRKGHHNISHVIFVLLAKYDQKSSKYAWSKNGRIQNRITIYFSVNVWAFIAHSFISTLLHTLETLYAYLFDRTLTHRVWSGHKFHSRNPKASKRHSHLWVHFQHDIARHVEHGVRAQVPCVACVQECHATDTTPQWIHAILPLFLSLCYLNLRVNALWFDQCFVCSNRTVINEFKGVIAIRPELPRK